jgi:RNA polymerase sigma factor (TIGR02999 family)
MDQASDLTQATQLLKRWSDGDDSALHALMPMVYEELRTAARVVCQKHDFDGTMQPTALVHEAYMRMAALNNPDWSGRTHFLAVAAKAMRQLVIDNARARQAAKRGGGERTLSLDTSIFNPKTPHMADVLAVEEALQNLAKLDERKAKVVEMRFFGGLTNEEVAQVLGVARSTVADDWTFARAWLAEELQEH